MNLPVVGPFCPVRLAVPPGKEAVVNAAASLYCGKLRDPKLLESLWGELRPGLTSLLWDAGVEPVMIVALDQAEPSADLLGLFQGVILMLAGRPADLRLSALPEDSPLAVIPPFMRSSGVVGQIYPEIWKGLKEGTRRDLLGEIDRVYPSQDLMVKVLSSAEGHANFLNARLANLIGTIVSGLEFMVGEAFQEGEVAGIKEDIRTVLPICLDLLTVLLVEGQKGSRLGRQFWGRLSLGPTLEELIHEVKVADRQGGNENLLKLDETIRSDLVELGDLLDGGMIIEFSRLLRPLLREEERKEAEADEMHWDWAAGARQAQNFQSAAGGMIFLIAQGRGSEADREELIGLDRMLFLVAEAHEERPGSDFERGFVWHLKPAVRQALPALVRLLLQSRPPNLS